MKELVLDKMILRNVGRAVVLAGLLLVSPALGQSSGGYELSWSTIDGGGGRSTGGPYTLAGTIGQPDAAWSSGGQYELLGGFWPGGPICIVQFNDFARFSQLWRLEGTGLPADLDGSGEVDFADLGQFADLWLRCCPAGWPLK